MAVRGLECIIEVLQSGEQQEVNEKGEEKIAPVVFLEAFQCRAALAHIGRNTERSMRGKTKIRF